MSGFGSGFKRVDGVPEDAVRMAWILDQIAQRSAVRELKAFALAELAPKAGEDALDVGSGTGEDVAALRGLTGCAVGVEPSEGLRAESVRRFPGLEIVDGDALKLPFDDASFDVVRCERVLQHLADPAQAVAEMTRVLRPTGRIALIDTDWGTALLHPVVPGVYERLTQALLADSANPYAGRTLRALLADNALTITAETAATWIEPQSGAREGFLPTMIQAGAANGTITPAEAEALTQTLAEAADRGAFHMSLTMYAVVAVKP
ncbi:methyltransferase domain-containing protein [Kribbella sp. NPDC051770]|uniref:methyltransferase domain-containing protein n=1 Tax=Kribbella sp. NPDC051770 TaxID=3155413 RepID=UPI00343A104E